MDKLIITSLLCLVGCANTLHVSSDRVSVILHNRGDTPIDCYLELEGTLSTGGQKGRQANRRVQPGTDNMVSLWANYDEHFIDGRRVVECESVGP